MSTHGKTIRPRVSMSPAHFRELRARAEQRFITSAQLLSRLATWWLDRPDAGDFPTIVPETLDDLPPAQRKAVEFRLRILRRWHAARERGSRTCTPMHTVTVQFLAALLEHDKINLSARTLFYWDRSVRSRGVLGLVDGRSSRLIDTDAKSK